MAYNRALVSLSLVALVVFFTVLNVANSLTNGALSTPPIYDDNGYLLDAYRRLSFGGVNSIASAITSFLQNPPHAPLQTLATMAGFMLFGPNNFGPYVVNAWGLAVYVISLFLIARASLSRGSSLLLAAALIFVPAAGAIISELRPDMIAGVLFGIALYRLVAHRFAKASTGSNLLLGLLCALSVIAKPSAFVIVLPMLGAAALVGLAHPRSFSWPASVFGIGTITLAALVILVPYSVIWGPQVIAYVYQALVSNKDIWATDGSLLFHWTYHSVGPGGSLALGPFLFMGLAAIVGDITFSLYKKAPSTQYTALAYYGLVFIIYCGMAMTAEKTVYQGSFFYFPFIFATTIAASRLISILGDRRVHALVAALTAVAIFLPPSTSYQSNKARPETPQMLADISAIIVQSIRSSGTCLPKSPIYTTVAAYPITPEAVALDVAQNYAVDLELQHLFMVRDEVEALGLASESSFVLTPNKWGAAEGKHLPGVAFSDAIYQMLLHSPEWSGHVIEGTDPPTLFVKRHC